SHTLKRVKKEARISECDLVLPDQWARQLFVKIVNDEPQADVNKDYVIWRSKDQIREEVYSGAKIDAHITSVETGEDKKQHISAYLCLVKYEILNKITDIFAENGIIINSIELSSHAVYNYLSASGMLAAGDFALLNIGYEVCTVYFFKNYQPVYVRIIETAGRHFENEIKSPAARERKSDETPEDFEAGIKEKEKNTMDLISMKPFPDKADISMLEAFESKKSPVRDNFLKEIHLTFEFFASKFPQIRISKAYLSGGMCKTGGLDFFLSNFLSLEAVYASDKDKIQFLPLYAMKERKLHG
ncbi:MAG TPA: hypothetical protein PK467_16500, partial [Candidatus Wallbacteria bacterium]|nr:hypothetical protein [Candidatus Wallbacteria bacterium]